MSHWVVRFGYHRGVGDYFAGSGFGTGTVKVKRQTRAAKLTWYEAMREATTFGGRPVFVRTRRRL